MSETLRKSRKRAPVISLQSTASYTRPMTDAPFGGVPRATTYQDTLSNRAADKQEMYNRCVESLAEKKSATMLRESLRRIPIERIDEIRADTNRAHAAETQHMLETQHAADAEATRRMQPEPAATLATLAATLNAEPKHTLKPGLVKSFFSAGSAEGPFPGSRSEQGEVAAGAYYTTTRPGKYMTIPHIGKFKPNGAKYDNWQRM